MLCTAFNRKGSTSVLAYGRCYTLMVPEAHVLQLPLHESVGADTLWITFSCTGMKRSLSQYHCFAHKYFVPVPSRLCLNCWFHKQESCLPPMCSSSREVPWNFYLLPQTPRFQDIVFLYLCCHKTEERGGFTQVNSASYPVLVLHMILEDDKTSSFSI